MQRRASVTERAPVAGNVKRPPMGLTAYLIRFSVLTPIAVVAVLVNIFPYYPATPTGWGVLLVLAAPILLAGEYFGDRVLGASFVTGLSSSARIAYAVIVMGAVFFSLVFGLHLLEGHLAKWGA